MLTRRRKPKYMIVYRCEECGHESGYTELDRPKCRYCKTSSPMTMISKQELSPKVIADRLRKSTDNMMKNLEKAFEMLPQVGNDILGPDKDAETELLKLMAEAKKLRDQVNAIGPDGTGSGETKPNS